MSRTMTVREVETRLSELTGKPLNGDEGFLFPLGAGVPMIETSHEVSENIGIKVFAQEHLKDLPVPVTYYENERCWRIV